MLYAEDTAADADLTKTYFERNAPDFHMEVVDTGEECLARLAAERYDALLLDYHLPDLDGVDVLRRLATKGLELPVVVATAVGDEALVVQVLRLGACDYVPKQGNYTRALARGSEGCNQRVPHDTRGVARRKPSASPRSVCRTPSGRH